MMVFKEKKMRYAIIDNGSVKQNINFDDNGRPSNKIKRASPRSLEGTEKDVERLFLEEIKNSNFIEKECFAYKWVTSICPMKNINKEIFLAISEIIAFLIDARIPREVYRRRQSLIFWLERHIGDAVEVFSKNNVVLYWDNKCFKLTPPNAEFHRTQGNQNPVIVVIKPTPFLMQPPIVISSSFK